VYYAKAIKGDRIELGNSNILGKTLGKGLLNDGILADVPEDQAAYRTDATNPPTLNIVFSEDDTRATAQVTSRSACHTVGDSTTKNEFTANYSGSFYIDTCYLGLVDTLTVPTGNSPQSEMYYHNYFSFPADRSYQTIKWYKDSVAIGVMTGTIDSKCYWITDGTDVKFYVDDVLKYTDSNTSTYYIRAAPRGASAYMDIH
tara:strand:+ start:101 stop:703 length:603 start_codon:yes stop_codon:yes gene_type:complete